jgi:hypothetical protein
MNNKSLVKVKPKMLCRDIVDFILFSKYKMSKKYTREVVVKIQSSSHMMYKYVGSKGWVFGFVGGFGVGCMMINTL